MECMTTSRVFFAVFAVFQLSWKIVGDWISYSGPENCSSLIIVESVAETVS